MSRIQICEAVSWEPLDEIEEVWIHPKEFFMTGPERFEKALEDIEFELQNRIDYFEKNGKDLEARRLESKTNYDLDLLEHRKKVQRNYTANDGGASRFRTQARNSDKMTFEKMMAKFYERNSGAVVNQRPFLWIRKLLQSFLQVNGNTNESTIKTQQNSFI